MYYQGISTQKKKMNLAMVLAIILCTVLVVVGAIRILTTNLKKRDTEGSTTSPEVSPSEQTYNRWKELIDRCPLDSGFCLQINPEKTTVVELTANEALRNSLLHAKQILEGIIIKTKTGSEKHLITFGLQDLGSDILGQAATTNITLNSSNSMLVCEAESVSDFTFKECRFRPLIDSAYEFPVNRSKNDDQLTDSLHGATAVTIIMVHEILHTLGVVCVNPSDSCKTNPPRYCSKDAKALNGGKCIELEKGGNVGDGTHGVHFSESHYAHEIMTGWLDYDPRFNQSRYMSQIEGSMCHKYVSTQITELTSVVLKENGYVLDPTNAYVVPQTKMTSDFQCVPLLNSQSVRAEQRKDNKPRFRHEH